jgi:hypothetical protein
MSFLRIPAIMRIVAFSAVLILAGDIIADSIADTREGHCVSETSQSDPHHEKAPCSHCSCAVHIGAVVVADPAMRLTVDLQSGIFVLTSDDAAPPPLAESIDHPPQLG